eukprot:scaffold11216_cov126-Isochrysis_galbana.AAC.8
MNAGAGVPTVPRSVAVPASKEVLTCVPVECVPTRITTRPLRSPVPSPQHPIKPPHLWAGAETSLSDSDSPASPTFEADEERTRLFPLRQPQSRPSTFIVKRSPPLLSERDREPVRGWHRANRKLFPCSQSRAREGARNGRPLTRPSPSLWPPAACATRHHNRMLTRAAPLVCRLRTARHSAPAVPSGRSRPSRS